MTMIPFILIFISASHLEDNHKAPGWDSSPPVAALPGLSCGPGGCDGDHGNEGDDEDEDVTNSKSRLTSVQNLGTDPGIIRLRRPRHVLAFRTLCWLPSSLSHCHRSRF